MKKGINIKTSKCTQPSGFGIDSIISHWVMAGRRPSGLRIMGWMAPGFGIEIGLNNIPIGNGRALALRTQDCLVSLLFLIDSQI